MRLAASPVAPAALPKKLLRTSPATHKQMGLEAVDAISNWIWKNPENFFFFFSSSSDKYTEAVFFLFFFSFFLIATMNFHLGTGEALKLLGSLLKGR